MAISRLIESDNGKTTLIWKSHYEDFNNMTQLVVHEGQEAIFVANGQAADTFGPGRYKLDSENIPMLSKLLNLVTGISVFKSEVYFINKTVQLGLKWGTDSKVRFIEPTMGLPVEIGASGEMNLAVENGRKLLSKLVGTMEAVAWDKDGKEYASSLQNCFRPIMSAAIKNKLAETIKKQNIDIVEIDNHLMELSDALREAIIPAFNEYGLTVPQFYVNNVVLPDEDPNFRKLRELHMLTLQKRTATAEAELRTTQAESKAAYMTAEAEAEAKIKAAQRSAILEGQTTETEIARREAERRVIQAQAEAQASQMAGLAEAAVMQAKGYSQKDVIQADVQKTYAESISKMGPFVTSNGGSGASGSSIVGDMLGLGMGMAAMGVVAPQVGGLMKNFAESTKDAFNPVSAAAPSASEKIKCLKCGADLPKGAKFCFECGAQVISLDENEIICPVCGKKTAKGKFCMECGSPLVRRCPGCNAEIPQGARFCLDCGMKL